MTYSKPNNPVSQFIVTILFLLLLCPTLYSQGWEKIIDLQATEIYNEGLKVASMQDGGFTIVGVGLEDISITVFDKIIARVDRNGNLLWHLLIQERIIPSNADVKATLDGGVIVAGTSGAPPSTSLDIKLIKINASGSIEWERVYDNNNTFETAHSVSPTIDGGYIVGGYVQFSSSDFKMYVLKVSANGTKEWDRIVSINQGEQVHEILTHTDGTFTLAGWAEVNGKNETKLVKLDAIGNTLWEQTFAATANQTAYSAILHPDGSYTLSGDTDSNDQGDIWLLKVDSSGIVDWTTTIQLPNQQECLDFALNPDGGYVIAASTITNGFTTGHAIKTDSLGNVIWKRDTGGTLNGVSHTDEGGFLFTGGEGNNALNAFGRRAYAVKLLNNGEFRTSFLTGHVGFDQNLSCTNDSTEIGLQNWFIEAKGDNTFYGYTDPQGKYLINVDSGAYELTIIAPPVWQPCQQTQMVHVDTNTTVVADFSLQPKDSCAHMTVDISTPFLRRCFLNTYHINYCNIGTIQSTNKSIEIEFDPFLIVDTSSIPWTAQIGNTYTFPVGDLNMNECGSFWVDVRVDCDSTVLGQTHCVEATVSPSNNCLFPTPSWDGSITSLDAQCGQDSVSLTITNSGAGNMANPLNYIVAEDNIIMKSGQFNLISGAQYLIKVPSNGSTYRLFADQSPGFFPPAYNPSISIEGCGVDSSGIFSTGYVTMYSENDFLDNVSIDCQENIGAYDPNDKRAEPKGFGAEHYINAGDDLEYHIRFQNTGTDTAYTVVIRDTLSQHLDVSSLKQGTSSHPYSLTIINENILKFLFSNIRLVDSTENEPASHGFVKFRISQQENLPLGTLINNQAAIYFDFNEPVMTNRTFHEIQEDFIPIQIETNTSEIPEYPDFEIKVQPNPFHETTNFVLSDAPKGKKTFRLNDVMGRLLWQEQFDRNVFRFSRNGLQEGIYFYSIQIEGRLIGNGKIMIQSQ